jgi:hypothetical protein
MTLAENEEHLVEALRALPPSVADHVITWVTRLRDLGDGRSVDWSDTWTEEDLADARKASLSRHDEREQRDG